VCLSAASLTVKKGWAKMSSKPEREMESTYDPQSTETRLYDWWESQGYFRPEKLVEIGLADADGPAWCITMPPPNVTGALHLGHAMTAAVEDLMTRYYRMKGFETLFLPGSDRTAQASGREL
jgi:valyl-tRNA synthetase